MIFSKNLHEAAIALQLSSKHHFNQNFPLGGIKKHLMDKEYYAIHKNGLIGAAYYNGNDFHIGMIEKGYGGEAIRKLIRKGARGVISNKDKRTIKLAQRFGFVLDKIDNNYTYMVKK
jgi:hypothetical protein